ncbi:MAG: PAS-domain containing protein [Candidatus Contendobacter sp.]|jgi:PAS domain S-box-containing protein|nr:PAS-domain containing protein [Gammaproteobacteria bacterium]MCC8993696.1 PAS-domain containing protein [Candidatus Contendobacter sp.]
MHESPDPPLPNLAGLSDTERGVMTLGGLDYLHEAISIFDHQLRLVVWNRRFAELLDFPPDLLRVGLPFAELIGYNARRGEYGPGDPEVQTAERVRRAQEFQGHCFERTRPDGAVLEIRGEPINGSGFITVYEDITARKQAEAALRESHEQLEARVRERTAELMALNAQLARESEERQRIAAALRESENRIRLITDTVPVLIAYLDAKRRYQFVNQKHAEWFGVATETFIGRAFDEMLSAPLAERLLTHVDAALKGQSTHVEYELTTPVERMYVRSYFIPHAPRPAETESVVGCFMLSEDLTEYRQTQMALNQAQKLKAVGQLTGGIAHDFNNLLTVVLGSLAGLEDGLRDSPELYKTAHTAMNAARRGADLTRRLLGFSRQQTLQPRLVSPHQQLQEIAELLKHTLGTSIELETVTDGAVWNIQVDPGQLTNAVLNLAINARDAMPNGGRLRIEARNLALDAAYAARYPDVTPGDYVRLTIGDSGGGMAPEVIERAFEPFFTTKELGAGTGLGLSMVYGFIKQSDGHIRIHSQIRQGTTVELYLPRHILKRTTLPAPAAETGVGMDENRLRGREAILLVEDEPDIRDFVSRTLTGFGYTVREAATGRDALTTLATEPAPDLLLSDVIMSGGVSGYDLAIAAYRQCPGLRILLMSGYSGQAPDRLPFDCILLEKPFMKLDLAQAVRRALDRPVAPLSSADG